MRRYGVRNNLLCLMALTLAIMAGCESVIEELPSYEESSIVHVGDPAPPFEICSIDGDTLVMPTQRATLLILFSHTCSDCQHLMTDLQQSIGDGEHGYNIMAISRGGTQQEIEAFRNEYELRFPIAADEDKSIYSMYATMYVPRCYVVDQQGIVRFVTFEYEAGDVDRLLAELSKFIK